MDIQSQQYIASQPEERQSIMTAIHTALMEEDKSLTPVIEPMMGKEMIIYKCRSTMKYALAGVKSHMSLHAMPIYCLPELYSKYQALLPNASFQKGCINFTAGDQLPIEIVRQLFIDAASFDLQQIREDAIKAKKEKGKKKVE